MPDHPRRLHRTAVALLALLFGLGVFGRIDASAQTPEDPASQFGGLTLAARTNVLQITYDSPGTFPFSPVVQLSVPEAVATTSAGPSAYALSSLAFPGQLLANIPALLEQSGTEPPPFVEPYSLKAEASSPGGEPRSHQQQGTISQLATAEGPTAVADTTYGNLGAAPLAWFGAAEARATTTIDGEHAVSRTVSTLSDVSLLGGLVQIDSVVTELVARSDGESSSTEGGTTVEGATILGVDVTIDREGVHFHEGEVPDTPAGRPLGELTGPLGDVGEAISEPVQQLVGVTDDALAALYDQSGISIRVADSVETIDGGLGERVAPGLQITLDYDGRTTPVISDLLSLVPSSELPDQALIPGMPLNTSPQGLVGLLELVHITSFAVAPGSVSTNATPAFEAEIESFVPDAGGAAVDTGTPVPVPSLPSSSAGAAATPSVATPAPIGDQGPVPEPVSTAASVAGAALPLTAALLLALLLPLFGRASAWLADTSLNAAAGGCPLGEDTPTGGLR